MSSYVRGDAGAFRQLFDRYAPRVRGMLRATVRDEDVAHDLTQQTFFQLHRARHDFREGAALRPWLMTIAYNLRRDHLRAAGRRRMVPLLEETHAVAAEQGSSLEQQRAARRVREAVGRLGAKQREVIELHWFAEMPFEEVAQVLGIGRSTAKVRAHRGYQQLRALLGEVER